MLDAAAARRVLDADKAAQPGTWEHELASALADVKAKLEASRSRKREPLFGIDAHDLLRMRFDAKPWQIDRLVTLGGTAVVAGEPKGGIKTWLLIEGALAIATGTKMCGRYDAVPGAVAIFFAEDQDRSVHNRVRALLASRGLDDIEPGRLHLQPRGEFINVLEDEDLAWVIASARRFGKLDLLVLDPLRDVHDGEEDKSDSMRDVMRRLRVLGELLGCTVWVSHHTPKVTKDTAKRRPGQNLRGSSAIHGSVDSGLYIEPLDGDGTNVFRARVTSQIKAARSAGMFDLELAIEDDAEGAAVTATWTHSQAEIAKGSAKHQADDDAVFTWVRELAMAGVVLSRTALRDHDDRPIPEKRTVAALDRLIEGKRLARRKGQVVVPGQDKGNADA